MIFHIEVCAVCARPTTGYGYTPHSKKPIAWVCDDPTCLPLAKDAYMKLQREFSRLDALATIEGGNEGGAYLDSIGKFSLDTLTEEEWGDFCRVVVGGYREALQGIVAREAPF
jgi:hypothetical protein